MRILKTAAIFAVAASLSSTSAQALSLRKGAQPAEFPPASFQGQTYVDSRGCVYIRAGFAGSVNWVPRVSRDRKVVCGAKPSFGSAPKVAEAQPEVVAPAPKPQVKVAAPKPTVTVSVAPTPSVTPSVNVSTGVAGLSVGLLPNPRVNFGFVPGGIGANVSVTPPLTSGTLNQGFVPAPITSTSVLPQAAPVAAPKGDTRAVRFTCPANNNVSKVRLSNGHSLPVRCGPQQLEPVTYYVNHSNGDVTQVTAMPSPTALAATQVAETTYVATNVQTGGSGYVPVPIYDSREAALADRGVKLQGTHGGYPVVAREDVAKLAPQTRVAPRSYPAAQMKTTVPTGYREVWTDDRLNPNRGVQTVQGMADSRKVWTETVPRRLVVSEPVKRSPKTVVTKSRRQVASTVEAPLTRNTTAQRNNPVPTYSVQPKGTRVIARTSQGKTEHVQNARRTSARYVQVGSFADPENARRAIARLQSMGLKVSSSTRTSGGRTVKTILAGPFNQSSQVNSAISKARSAGFSGAFARR